MELPYADRRQRPAMPALAYANVRLLLLSLNLSRINTAGVITKYMGSDFTTSIGLLKNILSFYGLCGVTVQISGRKKGAAAPFSFSVIQRRLFRCFGR